MHRPDPRRPRPRPARAAPNCRSRLVTWTRGIRNRGPRQCGVAGRPRRPLGVPAGGGDPAHRRALRGRQRAPAGRRPAGRDRGAGAPAADRRGGRRAARRHGHGQVGHHGLADRAAPAAHARDGAEQDPRRSAGQRAARDAAEQRRRVLRLVLRLLPARGVHRADRHLHREGLVDQPGRRAAAARGHAEPPLAARRRRGRLGVVHLRPRHAAVLPRPLGEARGRRQRRARRSAARPRRRAVRPQRPRLQPGHLPRARRHCRDHPGVRGARGAHRVLRRRDRGARTTCTRSRAR